MLMVQRALVLGAVLSLVAGAATGHVPPEEETLLWYMGNCDPTTANSAGPGLEFILPTYAVNLGQLVIDNLSGDPDYNASDGLAWRVTDNDDWSRACWRTEPQREIDHITGATVVARVKTVSSTPYIGGTACGNVGICDKDTGNTCIYHWGGANNYIEETCRGVSATPTGDGKYHIIRMTATGRLYGPPLPWSDDFEAYTVDQPLVGQGMWDGDIDGGLNPTPPPTYLPGSTVVTDPDDAGNKAVIQLSGTLMSDAYVYVMAAPDAVTNRIVVTCKVKGTTLQPQSENGWYIHVHDINGGNIAQWYGGQMHARPRIASSGTVGTRRDLSGGGVWDTLKIEIDATPDGEGKKWAYFSVDLGSDGSYDTPDALDYTLAGANVVDDIVGEIHIESAWDYRSVQTVYWDDFNVDGDEVTEMARTIKVYFDENPTPVLDITPASPVYSAFEGWLFGTESYQGYGRQDIYFDWITGSNLGAYAPGEEEAAPPNGIGQSLIPPATIPLATIDGVKATADRASVIIPEAVVTIPYSDDNNSPWFFGIEESDRTAGLRVLCPDGVTAGVKAKVYGAATTTSDGERVIAGRAEVVDMGPYSIPGPLCMNNKAAGGGWLGAQQAVKEHSEWLTFDGFSYPDGALLGNDGWTIGNADADHIGVVSNAVRVYWNTGTQSVARALAPLPGSTTQRLTFSAKPGSAGLGGADYIWHVYLQDGAGTEIGRWYGYWNTARPRFGGVAGTTYTLDAGGNNLTIEWVPATQTVKFYKDGGEVYSVLVGTDLTPGQAAITTDSCTTEDLTQYVALDSMSLTNMGWVGSPDQDCVGLNNVGLIQRLYGKVTEAYSDPVTPTFATSYFHVDDGSGILGAYPHKGIKCMAPRSSAADDLPAVDDYVWVYGILGMQGGERYMYTYDGSWVMH